MRFILLPIITSASLALSACGGGSDKTIDTGSSEPPSSNQVPNHLVPQVKKAKSFAPYQDSSVTISELVINGEALKTTEAIDFSTLKNGFTSIPVRITYKASPSISKSDQAEGMMKIYQQPYSMVMGTHMTADTSTALNQGVMTINQVRGLATTEQALPAIGNFTYRGAAFSNHDQGKLNYVVNFKDRTGSGHISGLDELGTIILQEAKIVGSGISGQTNAAKVPQSGHYELGFYGPKAEEIAGKAWFDQKNRPDIGFAGQR